MRRQQRHRSSARFTRVGFDRIRSRNGDADQTGSIDVQEIHSNISAGTATIENIKVRLIITGAMKQMRGCANPNEWRST